MSKPKFCEFMDWKRRRTLSAGAVKRVAVVGGTHGNEANGVQLAKHFMRNPEEVTRPSFETEVFISNTLSVEKNVRYVEEDLNRCYSLEDLTNDAKATATLERKRAREVDKLLGPKSSPDPRCDLVIDLHNTTANSGIALLMAPNDDFGHELGKHLMTLDKDVCIVEWNPLPDWCLCPSVGRSGMTFEVGPCPWGCVIPDLYARSRTLLHAVLDYVEAHNVLVASGATKQEECVVPVYRAIGVTIDYPRNSDGEMIGMIHPNLQGGDFKEIKEGDPLFMTYSGETIPFKREEHKVPAEHKTVRGLFVNEAAYYEKKMALMLCCQAEATFKMLKKTKD
eukprot:gnl/MRDRNA2_/MRDRNA2_121238_c0_seq1.p1 gnl/MRDRNA2_/MRDRNA2_121238_c0~~gnl/MRDRNA2_/MRDRNA2_121238_c0_seq1.p1  ORF type:complete len:337 (-),score=59.26 gnl/MRDRNA2_/MRDRNA2_121238_c0_seq1:93-1103(-)